MTDKVKTKVRYTSLDVTAMTQEMQRMVGCRVSNIYDLNPSTYILKLGRAEEKHYVVMENGVRFHPTERRPDKASLPSGFTMRFRKMLRSKRLERVKQVGIERVVVLTFGTGVFCNHLILELYSQGNIILTDADFKILQCMRAHDFTQLIKTAVGETYPFEQAANLYIQNLDTTPQAVERLFALENDAKKKKKSNNKLKDMVAKLMPSLFPFAIEHVLLKNKIDPQFVVDNSHIELIQKGASLCLEFLKEFIASKPKGYLICRPSKSEEKKQAKLIEEAKEETKEQAKEEKEYFELTPFRSVKYEKWEHVEFNTFGEAAQEYFLKYKRTQHEAEQNFQELTWKKYEQIRKDQEQRMSNLHQEQEAFRIKAGYIERNAEEVEAVIKIVNTLEGNGYSWETMGREIQESKKRGDPLANMIHGLDVVRREVTLLLGDPSQEEQHCRLVMVQVSVDCNAFTNATNYYDGMRRQAQKELRTRQACEEVLQGAEKEARLKINKKKVESALLPPRRQMWFQKFNWFVSSEGVLVISGRDSQQNELLVKRYMRSGDLYMHSDYGGAASTIIKNPRKGAAVPRMSLEEAAVFTVCRSKAWDTKILSGAWWVYDDQVSKSAPTGQFLPSGSFMIRGKRNYLQPTRMEMGLTLLFRLDAPSAARLAAQTHLQQEPLQNPFLPTTPNDEEYAIVTSELPTKKGKNKQQAVKQQNESSEEKQIKSAKKQSPSPKQADKLPEQQKHKKRFQKKLKKLAKHLEEQDEEERFMIMKMLGAKEMKHMKDEDEQEEQKPNKKNKKRGMNKYMDECVEFKPVINKEKVLFLKEEVKPEEKKKLQSKFLKQLEEEQQKKEKENSEEEESIKDDEEIKDEQQIKEQEEVKEEIKEKEEQVDEVQIESELAELCRLTGRVKEDDKIENMVVMCAPYLTVKEYKYKMKLTPGGTKKGKAARSILHYFLQQAQEPHRLFMRSLPQQQLINAIIGNVKLAAAGLLKLQLKEKADKKELRKEADKKDTKKG